MKKVLLIAIAAAVSMGVGAATVAISPDLNKPTEEDLESDIFKLKNQISDAYNSASRYELGTLIRNQIDMEIAVLKTTLAMLQQKQTSWIRFINITYVMQVNANCEVDITSLNKIDKEISGAEAKMRIASEKARSYGGLIQAMALVEEQTSKATIAVLKQQQIIIRYHLRRPADINQNIIIKDAVGKKIDDNGAL